MLELPARFVMMRPVVSEDEKDYWDKISEQSEAGHTEWVYQDKKGNDVELMEVWGFGKKYDGRWRNGKRAVWTDAEEKMIEFSEPNYEEMFYDIADGRYLCFSNDYNNPPDFSICRKRGVAIYRIKPVFFIKWKPINAVEWTEDTVTPSTHLIIDNERKFYSREEAERWIKTKWPGWSPESKVVFDVYIDIAELSE